MNFGRLSMGAADGALTALLCSLAFWKLRQPELWRIMTADVSWLGPGPLVIVVGAVALSALAGGWVAALADRSGGLLPLAARWGLLALSACLAAWIALRATEGRGELSEIEWAEAPRQELANCEEYNVKATTLELWEAQRLKRAECAKLEKEIATAEQKGKAEAEAGAEFAKVSRAEHDYLKSLATSKFRRMADPTAPVDVATALQYGREVAEQHRQLPQAVPPPELVAAKKEREPSAVPAKEASNPPANGGAGSPGEAISSNEDAVLPGEGTPADTGAPAARTATGTKEGRGGSEAIADASGEGKPKVDVPYGGGSEGKGPGGDGAGGLTPFEKIAAAATCLYFNAPPPLCDAAIALINDVLGGLFGSDTEVRNEEIAKLMGALGEFAGVNGDFADFDPATFERRFAEFDFRDPLDGLEGFEMLLNELEQKGAIPKDLEGVRRALNATKELKRRYGDVAICAGFLRDHAQTRLNVLTPEGVESALQSTGEALSSCPVPLEIRAQGAVKVSRYFQEAGLLKGEDVVNCAFALAIEDRPVSPEVLAQAKLVPVEACGKTKSLLRK